jgi:hypothetical protein
MACGIDIQIYIMTKILSTPLMLAIIVKTGSLLISTGIYICFTFLDMLSFFLF